MLEETKTEQYNNERRKKTRQKTWQQNDCNPNDQENSHNLQIQTTSSKIRIMNFHLEIKLTVNLSWFQLYEPNINNLESKWSREIAQAKVPTTAFIDGREIFFLK